MDPDTQEWRVWGRSMHPYTLGVWLAVSTVAIYLGIFGEDAADYVFVEQHHWVHIVGGVAGVSSLFFLLGFLLKKWFFLSWGLMLAAAVFASRAALYAMDLGWDSFPLWISVSLLVVAWGAWLLERHRHA